MTRAGREFSLLWAALLALLFPRASDAADVSIPLTEPELHLCTSGPSALSDAALLELVDALRVEARKAPAPLTVSHEHRPAGCAPSSEVAPSPTAWRCEALLTADLAAAVLQCHDRVAQLSLHSVHRSARAPRLAWELLELAAAASPHSVPIVETAVPPMLAPPPDSEAAAPEPMPLRWGGFLGGGYAHEFGAAAHLGQLEAELQLQLAPAALEFALGGALLPAQDAGLSPPAGVSAALSGGEVGLGARAGRCFGEICLRAGGAVGWQWRNTTIASAVRIRDSELSHNTPYARADAEVQWGVGPWLDLSMVVGLRYAEPHGWRWQSSAVYEPTGLSLVAALRLGYVH